MFHLKISQDEVNRLTESMGEGLDSDIVFFMVFLFFFLSFWALGLWGCDGFGAPVDSGGFRFLDIDDFKLLLKRKKRTSVVGTTLSALNKFVGGGLGVYSNRKPKSIATPCPKAKKKTFEKIKDKKTEKR